MPEPHPTTNNAAHLAHRYFEYALDLDAQSKSMLDCAVHYLVADDIHPGWRNLADEAFDCGLGLQRESDQFLVHAVEMANAANNPPGWQIV